MARKTQVEFGIEPDTLEIAEEEANRRDISRSQLFREAVRNELQAHMGGEEA